jgi:UDP-N-acetylmuramoyl-L-alanyl-D-glutamate--2,6-diaminopimelate ligase
MMLNQMSMEKITHLAFEASSHGLDQNRADAVNIKAAGFTNFTREHLDYHGTMQEYFIAKARLFSELVQEVAVLNADIPEYQSLLAICKRRKLKVFSYGKEGKDISLAEEGINAFGQSIRISNPVFASFQRYNIMCALGLAYACDIPLQRIMENIENIRAAQGRLERVAEYNGAQIIVDYAHKPDALEKVMQFLKEGCNGRLIVVFGCGGDRDQGRRPIMGEIATRLGDIVIITDDNPRSENPAQIRAEILAAAPNAMEVNDRAKAISAGIKLLQKGDVLLIAGKGHEDYQIIGNQKYHF